MPKLEERIAAAETRLKQLKVRRQQIEARKRSIESKHQRSQDVRRKILVGAIVLAKVEAGEIPAADLRAWLDPNITRAEDRALFELPTPAG
jgi:hypothetical protein